MAGMRPGAPTGNGLLPGWPGLFLPATRVETASADNGEGTARMEAGEAGEPALGKDKGGEWSAGGCIWEVGGKGIIKVWARAWEPGSTINQSVRVRFPPGPHFIRTFVY